MPTESVPLVSILMAYYGNIDYVEDAIRSATSQSYEKIELIVVDDCSPEPRAQEHIGRLAKQYGFKLITNETNQGAARSFRTAFESSSGDYISILSHDDIYDRDKIDYMMGLMLHQDLDALFCNGAYFRNSDISSAIPFDDSEVVLAQAKGQSHVSSLITSKDTIGCLLTQGALYKRRVWDDLKETRSKFLLDDWPFTILVWRSFKASYDSKLVYYYRLHDMNIHKDYMKWLPARIQTICELVDPAKRMDGFSFIFLDISRAAVGNADKDVAYKLALCSYFLSESSSNRLQSKEHLKSLQKKFQMPGLSQKVLFLLSLISRIEMFIDNIRIAIRKLRKLIRILWRHSYARFY